MAASGTVVERFLLDTDTLRKNFPILRREVYPGVPLVFLDSAASSQKPDAVIDAMSEYYRGHHANIHRGVYRLAEEATEMYESARRTVMRFVGAARPEEIIFTRNATEAINLVARAWGARFLQPGDTILLTEMEHHSNHVPWQMLAAERDLRLEFIPLTDAGELDQDAFHALLDKRPKLLAMTQMSNVLGTINPVAEMIAVAHRAGAKVLVDGAQSTPHIPVRVRDLDADFFAFSAHKMCGPTGIGALYAKAELLNAMPPFLGGGDMIKRVEWESFEPAALPHKFEAGTPAIAEAVGFAAAVDYLERIGLEAIHRHEQSLAALAMETLAEIPGLRIFGPAAGRRGGVVAFAMDGIHPHDVAQILDSQGVAVRAGHHCAMPLHNRLAVSATTRASFYLYNTPEEIESLARGLRHVQKVFA